MSDDTCKCGGVKRKGYSQCRKCFLDFYKNRTTKVCSKCSLELSLDEFSTRSKGTRPRSVCKKCEAKFRREWRKKNPEEHKQQKKNWEIKNPEKHQRYLRRRQWKRLGLNPYEIEILYDKHDHLCQCCGDMCDPTVTDHCHITGKFRGFLCSNCNTGLGLFKDSPIRLQKAIEYLSKHPLVSHIQVPIQA